MAWIVRLSILVLTLGLGRPAAAHPVPFSYLDVKLQPGSVAVTLVVHIYDVAHDLGIMPMERLLEADVVSARESLIRALLLPRLNLEIDGRTAEPEWLRPPEILADRQSLKLYLRYPTTSQAGMVAVDTLMFPYDKEHQTFVNIYEGDELTNQFILNDRYTRTEYFAGTRQGTFAVVRKFVPSGIHHILIGPDHLLFLVGLLLLGGSIRQLLLVVTAFTVGHSVTLSLAALNILTPPASIIEPAIALSIVYVGADNLLAQGGRDVRAWIALAFGFIHGFGFANVLRDMGLPSRALGWSLFSFNFGVEIGQVMVVIVVASAFAFLRSHSEWAKRRLAFAGSIVVIAAGAYWFIERVFFPGGIL
jgi:hydrogenase/urease accessory protein HupE